MLTRRLFNILCFCSFSYYIQCSYIKQTLMNAEQESTTAILMQCVTTPKDRTTAHVKRDSPVMDSNVQVRLLCLLRRNQKFNYFTFEKFGHILRLLLLLLLLQPSPPPPPPPSPPALQQILLLLLLVLLPLPLLLFQTVTASATVTAAFTSCFCYCYRK